MTPNAQQLAVAVPCLCPHHKSLACFADRDSHGLLLGLNGTGSVASFAAAKKIPWLRCLKIIIINHNNKGNNKLAVSTIKSISRMLQDF